VIKMTTKEIVNEFKVIAPKWRGAEYPPFEEKAVNESKIPDCMRFKEYDTNIIYPDILQIEWLTQEDFDTAQLQNFENEIRRYLKANEWLGEYEIQIKPRGTKTWLRIKGGL